jgi:protein TonB
MLILLYSGGAANANPVNDTDTGIFAPSDSSEIYSVVEKMPEVEGGLKNVYEHIKYPPLAIRNRVEGKVFVKFIVDENGKVSNPEILKDIGSGCGEAVLKGIKDVKFIPGEQGGKKVKVYFTMPVNFKLD